MCSSPVWESRGCGLFPNSCLSCQVSAPSLPLAPVSTWCMARKAPRAMVPTRRMAKYRLEVWLAALLDNFSNAETYVKLKVRNTTLAEVSTPKGTWARFWVSMSLSALWCIYLLCLCVSVCVALRSVSLCLSVFFHVVSVSLCVCLCLRL